MSFGLSGGNLFINTLSTSTSVDGQWAALQVMCDYPDFNMTIDGVELASGDVLDATISNNGLIIYGNITHFEVVSGYFRLYGGTNLGV